MNVGASFTSRSQHVLRLNGRLTNFGKHSRGTLRPAICYEVAIGSLGMTSFIKSKPWGLKRSCPRHARLGNVRMSNGSSERFAASAWTTSSYSLNEVSTGTFESSWITITQPEHTWDCRRTRRSLGLSSPQRLGLSFRFRTSTDSIIVTNGASPKSVPGSNHHFAL